MSLKGFFTKKKIIFGIIILFVIGGIVIRRLGKEGVGIQTDVVKKLDLKQTVLATGQVTSKTDLSLSFKVSGVVQKVNVAVGDGVKAGQILANLEQKDQLAKLTQARGMLAQAQANYQKVLDGASNQEIAVAQRAVDAAQVTLDNARLSLENIKKQQQVAVDNAYNALLNSTLSAVAGDGNTSAVTVTVSGTYTGTQQGVYKISIYNAGTGLRFQFSGLESGDGEVKTNPVALGSRGLFIQFSGSPYTSDIWTITIPNTQASNYVTNYNAYQAALETQRKTVGDAESAVRAAEVALAQARASLDLKKAEARPADIEAAKAQILSAQGQVQSAQADLENTVLRAPAEGTITKVDIKVGELATALQPVMVLQDVNNLHVEANISEANIAMLKGGQPVDVTFDALGPDRKFQGQVQQVEPASTVISGVVNYKVTVALDKLEEIRPGMTANLSVLTAQKDDVLAVPQRAVINKDGKKYVRVVTNAKSKSYEEREVTTGLEADAGLVEIISGLSEGQEVVTFIKQK